MASLGSKKLKGSSCSSLQSTPSGEMASQQKMVKSGKSRKKFRSTMCLNNFLETSGDDNPVTESAKKSKITKRDDWLDFLPSLEGTSSQSSRTCTSESDAQDAETSIRKTRRGRAKSSRKTTRNLARNQKMLSVSEESTSELNKENAEKARQSKKKRKTIKQKLNHEVEDDLVLTLETDDKTEEKRPIKKAVVDNIIRTSLLKNSPRLKKSVVASPMPKVRPAAKLDGTPALDEVNVDKTVAKKSVLKEVASPMPKIGVQELIKVYEIEEKCPITPIASIVVNNLRKISSKRNTPMVDSPMPKQSGHAKSSLLDKVNKDEAFEEEDANVPEEIVPIKNTVVDNLKKISSLKQTTSSIADSPKPKQSVKLSSTPALIKAKSTISAIKNIALDNLRKTSVLRSSPKSTTSVSTVSSPKPKTSVAKLSNTPRRKNANKSYFTPLKSDSEEASPQLVTNSENEPALSIKNTTFDISDKVLPLDDEEIPSFDDDFCFDFTEIGDKKPTRRFSPRNSKISLKSDIVIEISDASILSPDKNATFNLSNEDVEPSTKYTEESSLNDDVFYDSICHLTSNKKFDNDEESHSKLSHLSDEVFYDSITHPNSTKKLAKGMLVDEEITWPSPKKLRSTFDKEDSNQQILRQSSNKNLRTTFDKSEVNQGNILGDEVFYDSICQPSSSKNATRSTFLSDEVISNDEIVHPSPKKKQRTTFDRQSDKKIKRGTFDKSKDEITNPSPKPKLRSTYDKDEIVSNQPKSDENSSKLSPKKKLRSTFDKSEITQPGTSLLGDEIFHTKNPRRSTYDKSPLVDSPKKIHSNSNNKSKKSSFASFSRSQSEDILEHLNITRRDSRKSSFKKKTSSFKYSIGSDDEASKRTRFVTMRRGKATEFLNKSTPLFEAKTQTDVEEFKKLSFEKSAVKSVVAKSPKIQKKSILKRCENVFYESLTGNDNDKNMVGEGAFQGVYNLPADHLDNLMLDNEKPDLLIDTFAISRAFSLKPQLLSPEPRRSSRRRWSQSEKTPIFDKLAETSSRAINKSVRFEDTQEEVPLVEANKKKSVKINSPLTTPKGKFQQTPMVLRKTPKPKFTADETIISQNRFDSYLSQTGSASTPRFQDKSLLKKVLTNEKSKAEKVLKTSRVKMPDFAKIHERRNGKLESIQDLVARKAQRAEYLMSGGKSLISTKETTDKESRKKLFGEEDKEKMVQASKLPVLKVNKMKQKIINKKRASLEKKQKELKSKTAKSPALKTVAPQLKKNKAGASGPAAKVISRFGFKMQTEKVNPTKEEQIKAVCTKSKFIANSSRTDQNRKNTAEVRTNRRFDLLMKMRANNKK